MESGVASTSALMSGIRSRPSPRFQALFPLSWSVAENWNPLTWKARAHRSASGRLPKAAIAVPSTP
jgi:hypothetical protein